MASWEIISEIFVENFPIGLFFISVILIGNFIKHILFNNNPKDLISRPTLDTFSLLVGFTIVSSSIFISNPQHILNVNELINFSTWIFIIIISIVFGFLVFNSRIYGKKFLKDWTLKIMALIGIIVITYFIVIAIPNLINISQYNVCLDFFCKTKFVLGRIISFIFYSFFGYLIIALFRFSNKIRRYRRK